MRRLPAPLLCGAGLLLPLLALAAESDPRQVDFNPAFLQGGPQVDVARFSRGNPVLPGDYLVDLHVNNQWVGRVTVRFIAQPDSDVAQPCIDRAIFDRIGVDLTRLPDSSRAVLGQAGATTCIDITALIADAAVSFEMSRLRLDVSVPQASMAHVPRDFVGPEYWDKGVPSGTVGYTLNTYRAAAAGNSVTRSHLDLQSGANYDSWHLRHRSFLQLVSGGSMTYRSVATYVTHDMPEIRSNLTLGDSFTDGAVFDSVGYRGISLATSDQMLPDSQREYAPVVRGIARTNAHVVITQNGIIILDVTMPPGPFEINDLYATGYGGDLNVAVYEADGSQQNFLVPFSPMAQMLRPGVWRVNVTAGSLQQSALDYTELFSQLAFQYGFNSLMTGYGGLIGAEDYKAIMLGVALNTRAGSLSVDMTQSTSDIVDTYGSTGQAFRFSYNKLLQSTQTNISVSAVPFQSHGYFSFLESQSWRQALREGADLESVGRLRRQWQLGISQNLPERWGSYFVSVGMRDYRGSDQLVGQLQVGYTNKFRFGPLRMSYSFAISSQDNTITGDRDRRIQASFSLPLGRASRAPIMSAGFVQNTNGDERTRGGQEVLIGNLGEHHQLSYSLSASQSGGDKAYTANGQYRGAWSSVSASASRGSGYSQQSLSATGGLVIHSGGVTLANQLTDTFGIVEAEGAAGARVTNNVGTVVNRSGFAVLPFLLPYRMNSVSIDPEGAESPDVEFKSTMVRVAPRLNSVVLIRFETVSGRAILITARRADGSEVPFGASIFDGEGSEVSLAGQDGRIYLRGIAQTGTLTARWGDAPDQQCSFTYQLPTQHDAADAFDRLDATCRASGAAEQK